jgi:hypothetical protein
MYAARHSQQHQNTECCTTMHLWHVYVTGNSKLTAAALKQELGSTKSNKKLKTMRVSLLLCLFAKLRKATITFVVSVHKELGSHWTDFNEI